MPEIDTGSATIHYDTHGDPAAEAVLLVHGLGAQMTLWDPSFIAAIVDRGYQVVRFDNRDVGLSSKTEEPPPDLLPLVMAALGGQEPKVDHYTLSDMADDAIAVLDALGIDRAHVVGASMGGMISQTIAIDHPERVASLTSIMSTTGDATVGQAQGDTLMQLMAPVPDDRDSAIERSVQIGRHISGPHFDEVRARELAAFHYDRCFHPIGVAHQMVAVIASGNRTDALRQIDVPTVVIHGVLDPLVTLSGGEATAAAVPGAELVTFDDMAHDLPEIHWPAVVDAIVGVAQRGSLEVPAAPER
ncbi:MAG: alpha/beta fold hydrolase [Actinomycetota bacterium]